MVCSLSGCNSSISQIPKKGKIYSVNEGNAKNWDEPTAKYVDKCKFPKDGSSPKSLRYVGRYVLYLFKIFFIFLLFSVPGREGVL
uniref:Fructose-1-6-bisphosphatase class 1 C-terminal domain-containing protein n=1 Tax=Nelumbo nucifera TaxID=4432 RepID=A0A822Z8L1_NELNU|nr:TPA_asm: hypothetical protein HUJ06_014354 [Nelumbo nucifera]